MPPEKPPKDHENDEEGHKNDQEDHKDDQDGHNTDQEDHKNDQEDHEHKQDGHNNDQEDHNDDKDSHDNDNNQEDHENDQENHENNQDDHKNNQEDHGNDKDGHDNNHDDHEKDQDDHDDNQDSHNSDNDQKEHENDQENHENEQENQEEGTEEPKKGKGKKCVRWADYEQFSHYLDTVPRRPPYLHGAQKKKWKEMKKKLQHLDCVEDVASVAFDRMKGLDDEQTPYDDETERIIDGLEGEGEGSKAYKEFKSYLETPGTAINARYGWRLHDPKIRAKLRQEAQDEIGLLNHKLRTGEWVNDVAEGKPFSVMDAMMKMEELRDSIALMDRMSKYDTLPPQKPS